MRLVGLTGGIGTGKSTVSNYLKEKGFTIVDLDLLSRNIYAIGSTTYNQVVLQFGKEILDESGEIDRKKLGSIVFSDKNARLQLNKLTGKAMALELVSALFWLFVKGERIVILDSPLLFETGLNKLVSLIIVVECSFEVQLQRVQLRDSLNPIEAQNRIEAQMPLKEKVKKIDSILPRLKYGFPIRNSLLALPLLLLAYYLI